MHKDFKKFASVFGDYAKPVRTMSDSAWRLIAGQCYVVIPAGGQSKRLRGVVRSGLNKITTPLPNGDTLLEYNIRYYRDAGIHDFVLLVGHAAGSVEKLIGDGSRLKVRVRYSHDPVKPVATGGAIRHALEQQLLDPAKYMLVHNGGDIFYGYPGNLPRAFVSQHLAFEKKGSVATILSAPLSLVQGSVLKIVKGYVRTVHYYAYVPMPYHAAATIFSPEAMPYFKKLFPLNKKMEFERTLFPYLSKLRKLTAMKVDNDYFLAVKNEKQWEELQALFTAKRR